MWCDMKWLKGQSPRSRQAATSSFMGCLAAPLALKGTSISLVWRFLTSSTAQNRPRPRTSPTDGWRSIRERTGGSAHLFAELPNVFQ